MKMPNWGFPWLTAQGCWCWFPLAQVVFQDFAQQGKGFAPSVTMKKLLSGERTY
jgi:hypothetical protein